MRNLFLQALNRQNSCPRPPVWVMRQAGRYLPSYQKIKDKYPLIEMFHHREIIEKVTLLPLMEFDLDAAIIFSDILIILEVLGFHISFDKGKGPVIFPLIKKEEDIIKLQRKNIDETLFFIFDAIKSLKKRLSVPLIGFCGGPLTVLSYLFETSAVDKLNTTIQWIYKKPDLILYLLQLLTQVTKDYIKRQIHAGVDCIQIFDSWAGCLPLELFNIFAKPFLKELVSFIKSLHKPVIIFSRNSSLYFDEFQDIEPTAISCDGMVDITRLKEKLKKPIALQGDLDPRLLLSGTVSQIEEKAQQILTGMQDFPGFIFNLGHGILPTTPLAHMKALINIVHTSSLMPT